MLAEHVPDLYLVAVGGARVAREDIFVVQKRAGRVGNESRRLEMILLDFDHVACMMREMDVIVRGIGFKSTRFHHPDANSDPKVGKLSEATFRVLARKSLSDLVPPLLYPPCIFK